MFFKLVSTLLLVSAVLADRRHAYPGHQLQSLKRADDAFHAIHAGALFKKLDGYTYATATFKAPAITGPDRAAIAITVALNGGCPDAELAGMELVAMKGAHGETVYKALVVAPNKYADTYDIQEGDRLKCFVDGATGDIHIHNLSKGRAALHASFDHAHVCAGRPSVMVSQLPSAGNALAHFGALTFEDVVVASRAGAHPLREAERESDSAALTVSFDDDRTFTVHQNA